MARTHKARLRKSLHSMECVRTVSSRVLRELLWSLSSVTKGASTYDLPGCATSRVSADLHVRLRLKAVEVTV